MEAEQDIAEIIKNCCYTIPHISSEFGISKSTLYNWQSYRSTPSGKNLEKAKKIMSSLKDKPKMEKHPSYGYVTADQIKQLHELGIGPARDALLKKIEKQNKMKGKVK